MKNTLLATVVCSQMGIAGSAVAADVVSVQKETVAAFPDLGRAESPLHKKFIELYGVAKAGKDPVLAQPDWPLVLARRADTALRAGGSKNEQPAAKLPQESGIAELAPIKLTPLKLYVPTSEPPDFTAYGRTEEQVAADWQKAKAHHLTLPAQIFAPGTGIVPAKLPPSGVGPDIWRTLSKMQAAGKANDLATLKSLTVPELRSMVELNPNATASADPGASAQVVFAVDIEGTIFIFLRPTPDGPIAPIPLVLRDGEYLMTLQPPLNKESQKVFYDLVAFLQKNPPSALLEK